MLVLYLTGEEARYIYNRLSARVEYLNEQMLEYAEQSNTEEMHKLLEELKQINPIQDKLMEG